ncbi:MAG: winged helix DNA-binding domain-containing protein [Actinomycetes bacterium]
MARWTWAQACARRLERQALSVPSPDARPADVVHAMCAAHAQVLTAAEWSVGLRIAGATRAQMQEALWTEHTLVKSFGPRGTVHLLAAKDLPMWVGALSAIPASDPALPQDARLTTEQADAVVDAIAVALQDAELTVEELDDAVVAGAGAWAGDPVVPAWYGMRPRWRPAIYRAARRGVLCFGANRGRQVTYTSPRRWLPGLEPTEPDAALAALVAQYLGAFGPATPAHFAQWLGVPRRWATELFDSLSGQLDTVDLDGTTAKLPAGEAAAPSTAPVGVRLLPYFDAYSVGCQPRAKVFPGKASERALAGGQAGNFPVVLVDGMVAGVWHQRLSGRRVAVTVEPLHRLTAATRRDLDEQVQRLGSFLAATPTLSIGKVTVGAHA